MNGPEADTLVGLEKLFERVERERDDALAIVAEYKAAREDALNLREEARRERDDLQAKLTEISGLFRSEGALRILEERNRQVTAEGWTPEHDDGHVHGELAIRAAELAVDGTDAWVDDPNCDKDPWGLVQKHGHCSKNGDRKRALAIAGALLAAELDRVLRKNIHAKAEFLHEEYGVPVEHAVGMLTGKKPIGTSDEESGSGETSR
jgi:hypothetical protein